MTATEGDVVDKGSSLKPKSLLGIRHVQMVLLFLAMLFAYAMRVNMSMAIVAMTDSNNENSFDWSMQTQSVILSSFFWGYIVLQIPAGEMAAKFGGSILITIVIAGNSTISLLIPLAAYYGGWQAVCACRVLQGLTQGFLFPSMHNLIGKWVPLEEKSRLGTFIYAGAQLGTALQLLVSGFLADYWGWSAIFYVNAALGAIWTAAYIILGSDSPQKSRMISDEEKLYIQTSLGQVGVQKKLNTPWKIIWTSLPFYALIVAHCGQNWGFWTLMTEMPSYMKQILDIKAIGFPFGFISDYVIKKKWVNISAARKISNTIGQWGPAFALIGLSYVPAGNVTLVVGLLTIVVGLNAGHYTGYLLVHIDMAPNFAGTMMGITNFFANIVSIISPLIAGLILQDETDLYQWRLVFYVSSAIYIGANLFFIIFATSKRQSWNEPNEADEAIEKKTEKVV
ncbi:unnamed protein product [Arctia plantaginis]|uniref:Putative inorganic phosphate cotransporter n=1 Tax=Arctia plantaginis TaxID=874455 RepID=A0A8S1BPN1_ARCPL|nr:unnamed protein product [Arctia plantaginis]